MRKQMAQQKMDSDGKPLWGRSIAWLLFLGPFFFLSYGYANNVALERGITDSVYFDWERHIPFVPWTILPYWSIDLFYGLSFLLCRSALQVDRHALRLLTAQVISVSVFLIIPLHFSFARPNVDGFFGNMFDALMGFDKPYNQAPSLHISLLVILWFRFSAAFSGTWKWAVHAWAALIGISVLTTFQHHFIDIPTGALVGFLCLWIWPDSGPSPLAINGRWPCTHRRQLASYYAIGALALAVLTLQFGGLTLWLWWPAAALTLVALFYVWPTQANVFQKHRGRHSIAVSTLLAPYVFFAWLNSRWWTRKQAIPDAIMDDVWLGRLPSAKDMHKGNFAALCDFTAELPAPRGGWHYAGLPWLDLVPPDATQLKESAELIEAARKLGPVLVCCALGYSRSASAVIAWLILTGRTKDLAEAEKLLRARRPQVVLNSGHRKALSQVCATPT